MLLGPVPASLGLRVSAPLVAVEALALITNAVIVVIEVIRFGLTGPAEVSNVPAFVLEVLIFLGFGVALLFTARGLWQAKRPARAPAVLAQIIALVVGGPLAFSTDPTSRILGIGLVVVAGVTIVALLSRGVTEDMLGPTS